MNGEPLTRQKILRTAAVLPFVTVCGLAAGFTAGLLGVAVVSSLAPGTRDYIVFWATAQQLTHHSNPYDENAITRLERKEGLPPDVKIGYMRNPPWSLPLIYPLGFFSARVGWLLWSMLLLACLAASVRLIWIMYGRPRNSRFLLGLSFAPALYGMLCGQTTLLMLPGLVLFLRLHRTRPFLAGLALGLLALKPHLFLPFGVVLVAWVLISKSYKLVAGASVAMAAGCAITYLIDPMAWTQYFQMVRTTKIDQASIPCLSYLLRDSLLPRSTGLLFLPAALGCVWALGYFWPRRRTWDWTKDGSLLMLVSLLVAPYSWIYDQGMVIPALLQGAYLTRSRNLLIALAFLSALVEIVIFRGLTYPKTMHLWMYWTAPAWLAWYLVARAVEREPRTVPSAEL